MAEDRALELAQSRARLQSELLVEHLPRVPVGLERIGLAAAAVEGEDEVAAQPLAERIARDQAGQLRDQLAVSPELEIGLEPILERGETQLFQRRHLGGGEGHVQPGERHSPPERVRCSKQPSPLGSLGRPARLGEQRPKPFQVELARLEQRALPLSR